MDLEKRNGAIREMRKQGFRLHEVAMCYNLSEASICRICKNVIISNIIIIKHSGITKRLLRHY
jgi:recombinational DNA repair protein RecR